MNKQEYLEYCNLRKITLEEAQSKLKSIKKNAKKNGLITRSQAITQG